MPLKTNFKRESDQLPYLPFFQQDQDQSFHCVIKGYIGPSRVKTLLNPNFYIWQQKGSSIVLHSRSDIESLEKIYEFREKSKVIEFLKENSFLFSLLLEAHSKIKEYIPFKNLFLEVIIDPDDIDNEHLVISIMTTLKPKEAVEKLYQFDEDWWLNSFNKAKGKLCINLEF